VTLALGSLYSKLLTTLDDSDILQIYFNNATPFLGEKMPTALIIGDVLAHLLFQSF
jgi:hypothetical protein